MEEIVDGVTWVELSKLEPGVSLELAGRVVLLIHTTRSPGPVLGRRYGMVGRSDALVSLLADVERAASHNAPVLLRGESGSGKELVARAIHEAGPRAKGPYLSVNVAAIPESTAAAELFGYKKGAFTGASESHGGWFGRAEGGTLFLDEIGETPDAIQPMLLRALESGEVQPVGGQGSRQVDVRIVAATDAKLEDRAAQGSFRFPLLQRLGGHVIVVPPLRERRDDLGALLLHFIERELYLLGETLPDSSDWPRPWLGREIVLRALAHDWPGNVRELSNFVRELVQTSRGLPALRIGRSFSSVLPSVEQLAAPSERASDVPKPAERSKEPIDDEQLVSALRSHDWRIGATAKALGISKNTLYQLMERSSTIRKARDLNREEILACRDRFEGDAASMANELEVSERGLKLRMRELGID